LALLGPSVFITSFLRKFWGIPENLGIVEALTEQITTDEPRVKKERGDTELSAAILGKHLTVYKWPRNSFVFKNHFSVNRQRSGEPDTSMINHTSPIFIKKKITQ